MAQNDKLKIPVNLRRIAAMPEVDKGEQDEAVNDVQNYLKRFGYMREDAVAAADTVDDDTSAALTRFQQRYGLEPTGMLDEPTRELMGTDRCGLADIQDPLAFNARCAWNRRNLRFAFGPLTNQVTNAQARGAVIASLNTWAATGVGLSFTEVATNQNPDFIIDWRAANDPDHSMVGGVVAHADFPPGCSVVVANPPLPLHFDNSEHTWRIGAVANAFDIETVSLHEVGHLLGLGHTNVAGSVMWPFVNSNSTMRVLQPDDLAGIRALYPQPTIRATAPALNSDGRLEVFAIGAATAAAYNKWQTVPSAGPWSSGWNPLGGLVKQISVARNGDGRLELFGIGMDDALYNAWQAAPSSGPWSAWHSLGGGVKRIAGILNQDGRLEVFAIGMDNALWHIWQTAPSAGPWSGWASRGGFAKEILPMRNADGRLEVFAIGGDNAVWAIWQNRPSAGPWSGWASLGGWVKQLAAQVNHDGRMEIFGIGSDNAVWHKWQMAPSAGPWSGWNSLGGFVKHLSAARNGDGRLEIFGVGSDDRLWARWQPAPSSGPWAGWAQLP